MREEQVERFLGKVCQDIDQLPISAVQLVGALISMGEEVPRWLSAFIMRELGKRTDMNVVSPAAEAVMFLDAFGKSADTVFAQMAIQRQLAVLKAVAMEDKVLVATAFVKRLTRHIEELAQQDLSELKRFAVSESDSPDRRIGDQNWMRPTRQHF